MWPVSIKARLLLIATLVSIIGGSIGVANQVQLAEPMWLATRSFVRDQVEDQQKYLKVQLSPIEKRQVSQEILQIRSARNAARDKLFDLQVILDKPDGLSVDLRKNIEQQKISLQDRLNELEEELKHLRAEKNR